MSDKPVSDKRRQLDDSPWGKFLLSVIFGFLFVYLHNQFTDLETGAVDSIRTHAIVVLLYKLLGHIPTIAIFGVLAVILFILGVRQLIQERQAS
jgi:hypothetical protein